MVRDLVGALEDAGGEPRSAPERIEPPVAVVADPVTEANAEALLALRARLDALALDLARREGEAHASTWKIEELERRLAQVADVPAPSPDERPDESVQRSVVLDELDALRQALVQEHAARVRVEAGEEMTRLRAEVARQAALLDQLAHAGHVAGGHSGEEASADASEHEVSR
jgi:hypothetical protein